jgi:hypothetical protein
MVLPSQGARYCAKGCKALGWCKAVPLMIPLGHQTTSHSIYAFYPYRALQVELAGHLWRKHEIKPYQNQWHWYRSTCLALLNRGQASLVSHPRETVLPSNLWMLSTQQRSGTNRNKVSWKRKFIKINLQQSQAVMALFCQKLATGEKNVALIQQPWVYANHIRRLHNSRGWGCCFLLDLVLIWEFHFCQAHSPHLSTVGAVL